MQKIQILNLDTFNPRMSSIRKCKTSGKNTPVLQTEVQTTAE